jgi:carbonic anhydrase
MRLSSALIAAVLASMGAFAAEPPAGPDPDTTLQALLAGNRHYMADEARHPHQHAGRRIETAKAQHPVAIILGCADSRVPPEVVFDQGLGDLFVVRDAGNIVSNEVLGSIEYAVEHGTKLIVVLGHQRCGAVTAAVEGGKPEGHVGSLVDAILPAVRETRSKPGDAVENALRANVVRMVGLIQKDELIAKEGANVKVVGARYDLDTGAVEVVK